MLRMMYEKPERWAFTFQTYACLSRIRAQLNALEGKLRDVRDPVLFFERSVYSDRCGGLRVKILPGKSRDVWGWKGDLQIAQSKPPAKAGSQELIQVAEMLPGEGDAVTSLSS